jgi:hypothetical protein
MPARLQPALVPTIPLESNISVTVKTFYEEAFGPADNPMERMFERWERGNLRHGLSF